MPSAAPVEVTWPVLVMLSGLSLVPSATGPVVAVLIVLAMERVSFPHHCAGVFFPKLGGVRSVAHRGATRRPCQNGDKDPVLCLPDTAGGEQHLFRPSTPRLA